MYKERNSRIITWIILLILAAVIGIVVPRIVNHFTIEKTEFTVYAPKNMKGAFKEALKNSGLAETHKVVFSSNREEADIVVTGGKAEDSSYEKLAYSPFICASVYSRGEQKKLEKANWITENQYDSNMYHIDLRRIIDNTVQDSSSIDFGLEEGNIMILYPSKTSPYWQDFEKFIYVVINGGEYPENEIQLNKAKRTLEKFITCDEVVSYNNFYEKYERTGGFSSKILWIIPESVAYDLHHEYSDIVDLFFPTETTHFDYYIKFQTPLGEQLKSGINEDFYNKLRRAGYRSDIYPSLHISHKNVYHEGDTYNLVEIPDN